MANLYTTKKGDTLDTISKNTGMSIDQLNQANKGLSPTGSYGEGVNIQLPQTQPVSIPQTSYDYRNPALMEGKGLSGFSNPTPTSPTTTSPYYSRANPYSNLNENDAINKITNPTPIAEQYSKAYESVFPKYSAAIDAVTQRYNQEIEQARQRGVERQGQTRAQGAAFGLSGSGTQEAAMTGVAKGTERSVASLENARSSAINDIITKIHSGAEEIAKAQATQDETTAQNVITLKENYKTKLKGDAEKLFGLGQSPESIKEINPDVYQQMLNDVYMGNENAMKADFVAKSSKDTFVNIDKPIMSADGTTATYMQQKRDPLTGQTTFIPHTIKTGLPAQTDPKNVAIAKVGSSLYAIDKSTMKATLLAGGGAGSGTGAGGGYQTGQNPVADAWASKIITGQAKWSDIPAKDRSQVALAVNSQNNGQMSQVQINLKEAKKLVDELKTHPGRAAATGAPSMFTNPFGVSLPASDARDFKAKVDRLNNILFLSAIPQMKGMGALSNAEGMKLATSQSTIKELGVSEPTYLKELDNLGTRLEESYKNLGGEEMEKAGSAPSGTTVTAPDGTEVEIVD